MSLLCDVLDVLLVEVQGFLQELPLLAVCRLAHRRAARDEHLRWLVGYWRLYAVHTQVQRDWLADHVRSSMQILWSGSIFYGSGDRLSREYAGLLRRVFDILDRGRYESNDPYETCCLRAVASWHEDVMRQALRQIDKNPALAKRILTNGLYVPPVSEPVSPEPVSPVSQTPSVEYASSDT